MSSTSGYATLGTPLAFFASLAHTPRADSWLLASHLSHASADSNGSSGMSGVMSKVLQGVDGAVGDPDPGQGSPLHEHDRKRSPGGVLRHGRDDALFDARGEAAP